MKPIVTMMFALAMGVGFSASALTVTPVGIADISPVMTVGAGNDSNWTNYFKPYPPDNAIVKVKVGDSTEYGLPDKDHKYGLDGYWDEENGVEVHLLYVTTTGYLFADGCKSNTWDVTITCNAQEVYPPAGVEAIKAQAKSGSTYYLTLKEAIEKSGGGGKGGMKISLNDKVALDETLTVTNTITLNLNTNEVTLGSALTEAFHFTATATISNGTINSSLAGNVKDSVLMRFTDCKATLMDMTVNGSGYERVIAHDSATGSTAKYSNPKRTLDAMLCDGLVLTGNGCLFSVDYANATLTNGCSFMASSALASFGGMYEAAISCTGNGTVTIAGGAYAAPKVLQSGDLGGEIVVNGGTFGGLIYSQMSTSAHTELEKYNKYKARFTFNAGTYTDASIAFAYADSLELSSFAKAGGVAIAVPSGYAWKDDVLVRELITAGVTSDAYSDAQSATNAAAAINASKASYIAVPAEVVDSAKETYLSKVAAAVTDEDRIVIDLTPAAACEEQSAVDGAVTNETAAVALTSTNATATATLEKTTPGLYYWIEGGTEVGDVTLPGESVLSKDGGQVILSKPTLDETKGRAFFKIAAGVAAPVPTNAD